MQVEYIPLESIFPRKTVVFWFEIFYVPLADVCLYCRQGILVSVMIFEQKTKYFDRDAISLLKLTFFCLLIKTEAKYSFWNYVAGNFCASCSLGCAHSIYELFPALKIKFMEAVSFMEGHVRRELICILT